MGLAPSKAIRNKTRIALWVWYRGEFFRGFQAQAEGPTVQASIAQRLEQIGLRSRPCAAGRTDKGVHARMQVLSLRCATLSAEELCHRVGDEAERAWGICFARNAGKGFHAQWSTVGKEYRYRLSLDSRTHDAWQAYCWHPEEHPRLESRKIDVSRLARALQALEGTRDFGAFHESSSPRGPRTVDRAELVDAGRGLFEVRIRGDRFGRHQVRFMVGSATAVAAGALDEDAYLRAILEAAPLAGLRAPAHALVLWEVWYPRALDPFDAVDRASAGALLHAPPFAPIAP